MRANVVHLGEVRNVTDGTVANGSRQYILVQWQSWERVDEVREYVGTERFNQLLNSDVSGKEEDRTTISFEEEQTGGGLEALVDVACGANGRSLGCCYPSPPFFAEKSMEKMECDVASPRSSDDDLPPVAQISWVTKQELDGMRTVLLDMPGGI